jgi:hypothetical protein
LIVLDWGGKGLFYFDCDVDYALASKFGTALLLVTFEGECWLNSLLDDFWLSKSLDNYN